MGARETLQHLSRKLNGFSYMLFIHFVSTPFIMDISLSISHLLEGKPSMEKIDETRRQPCETRRSPQRRVLIKVGVIFLSFREIILLNIKEPLIPMERE